MQTALPAELLATDRGQRADRILRACVHCGFCLATCPTYRVTGSELDSPRGRIYLIKAMLEGESASAVTRLHLDRCLTCRACETTCPSGVEYHRLLAIGREEIERRAPRPLAERLLRRCLRTVLPHRRRFAPLLRLGQSFRGLLPAALKEHVPPRRAALSVEAGRHPRRVILVQGCVQPGLSPNTNAAAARVLDALGIEAVTVAAESCCGAMSYHLNAQREGREFARRNIDAWWPLIEEGVEAIVMTASGCGNFVGEYDRLLEREPRYGERARRVVGMLRDIAEVLVDEDLEPLRADAPAAVSWHCPCTARHGQNLDGPTREVLKRLGFSLPETVDAHLCCGSAGANSLLQPEISRALRRRRLAALEASEPDKIVTANVGCQIYLAAGTRTPVIHWIELVARSMRAGGT